MARRSIAETLLNRTPVPYIAGRNNISIPWRAPSGMEAQMRAMGAVGTLFAIVNRTSNAAAQVQWKLYRKSRTGLPEDRTEVTTHAALDLWNQPNRFFTRQELVETLQQHIDLTGEGWLVVARNPRSPLPLELWPVRPDRIQPVPHPVDFISGYLYTGPDGQEIALRTEDVIQIRMPNPLDPYRGMGPVQSVLTELDASKYSAEWNRNFFINGAEPGGIISTPKNLDDDEFDQLRDRWNEQHKGVANAHRVALLEDGMEWIDRKLSQRDMQFAELRSVSRDVIREAFGAPAFVLGEVGDVNRATAEASKVLFAEQLTVPRLERFKAALNNDLLPLYGKQTAAAYEFDYCDPVPADADARNAEIAAKSTAWKTLVDAGADPLLVSEYLGLPDLGYRAPAPPQPVQPAAPPAAVPAARVDLHHHRPFTPAPRQLPSYNTVLARPRPPRAAVTDPDLTAVQQQFDDALAALLEAWEPIAEAQYADLVQQIEEAVDAGDAEALAVLAVSSEESATVLRLALGDMAETAAGQMADEAAQQGIKVRPPKVDKGLRNAFGSELIEIAAATAALLAADSAASAGREALRLLVPGVSGTEVAEKVGGFLRGLKNWFRRDQLGAALHRAQNTGRVATLQAAPKARYFASECLDLNTCPPCRDIDGTEFEDLDAARAVYGSGGYQDCQGGSRCRGTVTAVWDTTTTEASMGRSRRCWNTATPEQIAARGRAMRPTLPVPGGEETWYRISNIMDEAGTPTAAVHIYGDIGSWGITAASFVDELKAIDASEINLYINSPGGEVFDGLAIHNALRSHRAKVMVQVDSLAASIASVIAMAGDRIVMSPHSQMMIHDAQGVSCGSPEELREYADFLDRQSDNIAAVYAERAGGTKLQWRKRMQAETWYFADEAVEAGLADEVGQLPRGEENAAADDRAIAAAWDLSVYNYAHSSREQAPAPPLDTVAPTEQPPAVEPPQPAAAAPVAAAPPAPVFDPGAFRAATLAALDPMPGYQPTQMRSLMASVAADAPAPAAPARPEEPYVPRPQDETPAAAVQQVAVDYWRSLFTAAAHDAPTTTARPAAAPTAPEPQVVYVEQPPPPAGQVVADYLRAVMTDVANHAPAPPEPAAPERPSPEPVSTFDPTAIRRALKEAEL
ncbi:head maturation protease, ClpP-related [Streptomyces sp. 1222.5]|uniref:head maturation protease, ClpP-related n=1 Tax=Streptomyces sp. 1222.5 TaxID=1881026 RepID=UPI003EBD6068